MKWDDSFEARPSTNVRDELVFDIYRKGTEEMIYSDIPINSLEDIKKQMSDLLEHVAREELENLLDPQEAKPVEQNPMTVPYVRTRQFGGPVAWIEDDDEQ